MQFNEKLKKLRLEKGITQAELAENVFVSRSAVAKWENGLGLPSGESLALLAEYFCVNEAELLSDPETATVIINKNNTLSKQKVSIIALIALSLILIIVAAILIPLATRRGESIPVALTELIFDTEKDMELEATNYSDSNLSADKYFVSSRIFTYNTRNERIPLPKLLFKQTLGEEISYTEVDYKDVSFSKSYGCSLQYDENEDMLFVVAENSAYNEEQSGCANVAVGDERLSLKIQDVPIPVESVQLLKYDDDDSFEVQFNGSIALSPLIYPVAYPDDATYKDTYFGVEKIVKQDGTPYEGNVDSYYTLMLSGFSGRCTLSVSNEVELGSKIYVFAETAYEHVRSNLVEITVTRVPVTDIVISSDKTETLLLGETCHFYPLAYEKDATFNVLGELFEITLLTPELATLTFKDGLYYLTATDNRAKAGEIIKVFVSTPEGYSKTFCWDIEQLVVKDVTLSIDTLSVARGQVYQLNLQYNRGAQAESVEFKLLDNVDGILFAGNYLIIFPTATVGTVFNIQAVVDGVESNILTLEIVAAY